MNIVYHFRVRGLGAEGVHIAGIAAGFRAAGHEVSFVSPSGVDPTAPARQGPPRPQRPVVRALHAAADDAPQSFFEIMELGYNAYALPRLAHAVRARSANLLYERYAFFNVAGALAASAAGVPLIVEVNELAGHERVRDQQFVELARKAERFVFGHASLVVAVSDFLREHVRALAPDVPVMTVPNGVPEAWRCRARLSPARRVELARSLGLERSRVLCFVGGLVHWHNFELLVTAFAMAHRRIPDAVLLLVGDGAERSRIEHLASAAGIGSALRLAGAVPHERAQELVELADATVIPHTNAYRSPIKLFEYMAAGRPIVAPRMPPIEAVVGDGAHAALFSPGDPIGLARQIERVLVDAPFATAIGDAAREHVFDAFTWETHAARILAAVPLLERAGVAEPRASVV